MTAWIVSAAGLTALTLALLLWPLLKRRTGPSGGNRAQFALRVYRDQLAEVERDVERGVLRPDQAEAARTEVKRRMLAAAYETALDAAAASHGPASSPTAVPRRSPALAVLMIVLLPAVAGLLYLRLGAPRSPDRPLAERQAAGDLANRAGGDAGSLEEAIQQLAKRLETNPGDAGGWFLLGRAHMSLGRYPEAAAALGRASALAPDQPDVAGTYAEALIASEDGRIGEEARGVLQRVLALDPSSPLARFLLALDRANQGDLRGAMQGWTDLLTIAPPAAPWLAMVRDQLNQAAVRSGIDPRAIQPSAEAKALAARAAEAERQPQSAGPGPSAEDMAAARQMTPEQREQMVRGMVDRLAARLRENPDDLDGWRRLARAYDVLGEPEKAAEARARIAALERR